MDELTLVLLTLIGIPLGILLIFGIIFMIVGLIEETNKRKLISLKARFKLNSSNPSEIEEFVIKYGNDLKKDMINQLISRVSELKLDESLNVQLNNKFRIENIENSSNLSLKNSEMIDIEKVKSPAKANTKNRT